MRFFFQSKKSYKLSTVCATWCIESQVDWLISDIVKDVSEDDYKIF